MSFEVKFTIDVGQYENVKATVRADTWEELESETGKLFLGGSFLGDAHASLRAAVLHGRDQARLNVRLAIGIEQAKAGETVDLGDFSQYLEDTPEKAQNAAVPYEQSIAYQAAKDSAEFHDAQDAAVAAVQDGLGATVLEAIDRLEKTPSRPWERQPQSKPKPWAQVKPKVEAAAKAEIKALADDFPDF